MCVRLLHELQPEMKQLVECACVFATQVAGKEGPNLEHLTRACESALDSFDEAFCRVRRKYVFSSSGPGARVIDEPTQRGLVLAYTFIFSAVSFIVTLQAVATPEVVPATYQEALWTSLRGAWAYLGDEVKQILGTGCEYVCWYLVLLSELQLLLGAK